MRYLKYKCSYAIPLALQCFPIAFRKTKLKNKPHTLTDTGPCGSDYLIFYFFFPSSPIVSCHRELLEILQPTKLSFFCAVSFASLPFFGAQPLEVNLAVTSRGACVRHPRPLYCHNSQVTGRKAVMHSYCPSIRQCSLLHVSFLWDENVATLYCGSKTDFDIEYPTDLQS